MRLGWGVAVHLGEDVVGFGDIVGGSHAGLRGLQGRAALMMV